MQDARALLDGLMGAQRNAALDKREARKFTDEDICKKFLLGLCPHELFKNTKMDIGPCTRTHNEHLKEVFEADPNVARYRKKWRSGLRAHLKQLLQNVDRLIDANQSRMARDREGADPSHKLAALKEDMTKKLKLAEEAADDSKFDESRSIMKEVDELKRRIEDIETKGAEKPRKGTICEVCGLMVSAEEMDDIQKFGRGWHTDGRQHIGFGIIREKIKELEKEEAEDVRNGVRSASPSPVKAQKGDASRKRAKSRSRSPAAKKRSKTPQRPADNRRRRGSRSRSRKQAQGRSRRSPSRKRMSPARRQRSRSRGRGDRTKRSSPPRKSRSRSPGKKRARSAKRVSPKRRSPSAPSSSATKSKRPPSESKPAPPPEEAPPAPPASSSTKTKQSDQNRKVSETPMPASTEAKPAKAAPVAEKAKEPEPPPEPETKPPLPVRFVLGLGKIGVNSLQKR
eukprot:TRINITY_DN72342_c0_g1_i1.p1 TRINITY_DN72342_c0_g1~~TRINITY_DN72342_c0_g1_i1.p1  ORF type:complete len:455 (-),score=81.50 TRINITY_DN72342_c0_g1_i1:266-1630(-)